MTRDSTLGKASIVALCGVGLAGAVLASLMLGGRALSFDEFTAAMHGSEDSYIAAIFTSRLHRTVLGVLCGAALSVSGMLIQGVTHNPLGDPGILGITVGASAAVVTVGAVTGSAGAAGSFPWAFMGALVAVVLVFVLSGRSRSHVALLLTGAVVSAVLTAYIQAVILRNPTIFDSFRFWVIGSLSGRDLQVAFSVLPAVVLGLVVAMLLAQPLNALALGDEIATSLGTPVVLIRYVGLAVAALLAAAATAAAGPIAFLGLIVPHLGRSIIGVDYRWLLPTVVALGATLLVAADTLGRVIARPDEVMVGIMTAIVGAPILMLAVRKGWATR